MGGRNMECKRVNKPWGHELWISDGVQMPYALKRIVFQAGNQTSLQVHKFKSETNYVLSGTGVLLISKKWFDVDRFVHGQMSDDEINAHIGELDTVSLAEGVAFHVTPGHLHRVIATTDLTFMEASSPELDDVIRLQDDTNRPNGKIDTEHK